MGQSPAGAPQLKTARAYWLHDMPISQLLLLVCGTDTWGAGTPWPVSLCSWTPACQCRCVPRTDAASTAAHASSCCSPRAALARLACGAQHSPAQQAARTAAGVVARCLTLEGLQAADLECVAWLVDAQVPFALVFTKLDKRKKKCPRPEQNIAAFQVRRSTRPFCAQVHCRAWVLGLVCCMSGSLACAACCQRCCT